jgi:hypothetical protein
MAEGSIPALAKEVAEEMKRQREMTLRERMAAIRTESCGIGKDNIQMKSADGSKSWNIKGHTIEAVLAEMRPLFEKYRIDVTPQLIERVYTGNRCDVMVDFEFVNLDNTDEARTIRWAGAGTDNGDKAFAKAGTNAMKEMLKKVFLITDRADAEEEAAQVEFSPNEGATRADVDKQKEKTRAALEQWAKALKMALEKAATLKDVQRLERENKDQLISEELAEVTRNFFVELIEKRKKDLAE